MHVIIYLFSYDHEESLCKIPPNVDEFRWREDMNALSKLRNGKNLSDPYESSVE